MSNKKVRVVWLIVKAAILRNKTKKKKEKGAEKREERQSQVRDVQQLVVLIPFTVND